MKLYVFATITMGSMLLLGHGVAGAAVPSPTGTRSASDTITDLEAKYKPRTAEMEKLQKELQDIQTQMQGGRLSQQGEQELSARGKLRQRELQRHEMRGERNGDEGRAEAADADDQRTKESEPGEERRLRRHGSRAPLATGGSANSSGSQYTLRIT